MDFFRPRSPAPDLTAIPSLFLSLNPSAAPFPGLWLHLRHIQFWAKIQCSHLLDFSALLPLSSPLADGQDLAAVALLQLVSTVLIFSFLECHKVIFLLGTLVMF